MNLPGFYSTISLDPPWPEHGGGKSKRGADRHYPLMSVGDIIETVIGSEPVGRLAPSAHCWCWVTDNYLEGGLALMQAMGFRFVRTLVWVKTKNKAGALDVLTTLIRESSQTYVDLLVAMDDMLSIGLGQYLRGAHELALFGVRGDAMVPATCDRLPSVVFAPKGRHSAKPDEAIRVFERVSPGPRIEMFARSARPGWDAWGNQAPGTEAAP